MNHIEKKIEDIEIYRLLKANSQLERQVPAYIAQMNQVGNLLEVVKGKYLLGQLKGEQLLLEESRVCFEEALLLAQQVEDKKWIAKLNCRIGMASHMLGQESIAWEYFDEAKKLVQEVEDPLTHQIITMQCLKRRRVEEGHKKQTQEEVEALMTLLEKYPSKACGLFYIEAGVTYNNFLGDYIKGIKCFEKAIEFAQTHGLIDVKGNALYYLGTVYHEYLEQPKEAVRYLEPLMYEHLYTTINEDVRCFTAIALTECYLDMGKSLEAERTIELIKNNAKQLPELIKNSVETMSVYLAGRVCLVEEKEYEEGIAYALHAKEVYEKSKAYFGFGEFDYHIRQLLGELYFKQGNCQKSLEYYIENKAIAKKYGEGFEKKLYMKLGEVYEAMDRYKEALECYRLAQEKYREGIKLENRVQYENIHKQFEKIYMDKEIETLSDMNQLIKKESYSDPLTQLCNRTYLDEHIKRRQQVYEGWILMMDIDFFKPYNDNYGHLKGDGVLKRVASCMRKCCANQTKDIIRYGGEEFLVIWPKASHSEALALAEQIREGVEALNIRHEYGGVEGCITISIGISGGMLARDSDYDKLIDEADQALYAAKLAGKNQVRENGV